MKEKKRELSTIEEIQAEIRRLLDSRDDPVLVMIDGRCGSGKSALAEILHEKFDSNLFCMDDFFLRPEQRNEERSKEIGGNVDYERFREELLLPVLSKQEVRYRPFDCRTMSFHAEEERSIPPKRLNIIEGSYAHHSFFSDAKALRIFVTIEPKQQIERLRKREGDIRLRQFQNLWIPLEEEYFKKFMVMEEADLVTEMHLFRGI